MKQRKFFWVLLFAVMLVAAACRGIGVSLDGEGNVNVSVDLTEADVNSVVQRAMANNPNSPIDVQNVDLMNGIIRATGTYTRPADNQVVNGTIDMTASVQNGGILIQISAVNVEGWSLDDQRITNLNARLAEGFAQAASQAEQVEFVSVRVTDNALQMQIKVKREQPQN